MVCPVVLVPGSPPWSGVLCWCVTRRMVDYAVSVPGLPHGRACCVGAWPASWSGVQCSCVAGLHGQACCVGVGPATMPGRAVLLLAPRQGWVCCACAWRSSSFGCRVLVRVLLWWACCAVVRPASWWGRLCWCVANLIVGRAVFVLGSPHGEACCVGAWPASWLGVLCLCVAYRMVGRAVLVCGPPHGRACCVGACPAPWWGVLCWCCARLHGGACFVGAGGTAIVWRALLVLCPPPWSVVLCWRVALVLGPASCPGALTPWTGVLCLCCAQLMVRGAVLMLGPLPLSGLLYWCVALVLSHACCAGASPPWLGPLCWCVARRYCCAWPAGAWLGLSVSWSPPRWRVLVLVRGVLAGSMLGLFCWFAAVFAARVSGVCVSYRGFGCGCGWAGCWPSSTRPASRACAVRKLFVLARTNGPAS